MHRLCGHSVSLGVRLGGAREAAGARVTGAGGVSGAVLAWVQGGVWVAEVVECGVVAISSLWSWVL